MAITYSVKAAAAGGVSLPNMKVAEWTEEHPPIRGGGDDNIYFTLVKGAKGPVTVRMTCEDAAAALTKGTAYSLVFTELTDGGTVVHTFANAVFMQRSSSAVDDSGTANRWLYEFECYSSDGTTNPHTTA